MQTLDANIKIIEDAKTSIRNAIEAKGISVPQNLLLQYYPAKVDEIEVKKKTIDLEGTGLENTPAFSISAGRAGQLNEDLDYSRKIYKEWDPATTVGTRKFNADKNLVYMPHINTGNLKDSNFMFFNCSNLVEVPYLDLVFVESAANMFTFCKSLVELPRLNFYNVTNISGMFNGCSGLKYADMRNLGAISIVTDMSSMFFNCTGLESVYCASTTSLQNADSMFYGCSNLKSVSLMDAINITNASQMFRGCTSLEYLGGLKNYKVKNLYLGDSPLLTHQSLFNLLTNLGTVEGGSITLHPDVRAKVTENDLIIARDKGWSL